MRRAGRAEMVLRHPGGFRLQISVFLKQFWAGAIFGQRETGKIRRQMLAYELLY